MRAYTSIARAMTPQTKTEKSASWSGTSLNMAPVSAPSFPSLSGETRMSDVGIIAIVLLACAVLVLIGAEWPRLSERYGEKGWASRARRKQKKRMRLIRGAEGEESDDFAKSVERDLANLPVTGESDDRSRR